MTRKWARHRLAPAIGVGLVLLAWRAAANEAPVFSDTGPDATAYGAAEHYPVGGREYPVRQDHMVGTYSHFAEIYPSRIVPRPETASPWRRADNELTLQYDFEGNTYQLTDYLMRNPVTGLLIAKDDSILFEHYQYGRTDHDKFTSQSMAKTVVSLLIGIALHEGAIHAIDDKAADYVPELVGTAFGDTPIRALLHMASGIKFHEVYDAPGDSARLGYLLFTGANPGAAQAVATFNTREAPPDSRFAYAGIDTEVLGLVLTHAVKMSMSDYLRTRIWQPLGAEADAAWTVDTKGQEVAYCCLNVVLRDWARIGEMLAHGGAWNGQRIVPADWVREATSVTAPFDRPGVATAYFGYGYQIWLFPGSRGDFALLGVHGQAIFVDPKSKLVLVHTGVRTRAAGPRVWSEAVTLWETLLARYGG